MKVRQKTPCFVFDLDGTLCDVKHRRQYVATKPRNWDAWNAGIANDAPNVPVISALTGLRSVGYVVLLVSGRSEEYREVTVDWLAKYGMEEGRSYESLYMRAEGDKRDDSIVKSEIADLISEKYKIVGVFDDRRRVVDMWLSRGIFVFDVGQGNGDF